MTHTYVDVWLCPLKNRGQPPSSIPIFAQHLLYRVDPVALA